MSIEFVASNVLREAVAAGVMNPLFPRYDNIDLKVLQVAVDNFSPQPYWQKDRQFAGPTQRYVESVFTPLTQIPNEYWLVELSQIGVPRASIGYLKSLEQFINDANSSYFPTSSQFWGIPHQNDTDLDQCRWYLRIEEFNGQLPPRLNISNTAAINVDQQLPGTPYWELAEFRDIWYPPHVAARFPNMVIPGGYLLRFFFYSPPTTAWTWQVMGRMRAVLQSSQCRDARYNTGVIAW